MAAPPVRIRIGASLDASVDRAFQSAVQKAGQAEKAIQRQKRETSAVADREAKNQLKAQERLAKASEQLDRQRSRGLFRQYQDQERAADRAARGQERSTARAHAAERREIEKTARAAWQAITREQNQRAAAQRATDRLASRQGESFARRTSHRASRFLMPEAPLGPMALRALGGVAQGAGIDFSIAGAVGRVVDLEQSATDLSNSGYQPNATGANSRRVNPRDLVGQARSVAGQFGMEASDVLAGLAQYQKIAGDLDTGRQSLLQMAALSRATGTNLADMAAATANVSNGLGDIPDKARIIDEVMRTIAGQGKLGAVEISDMATQMARIAAAASNFGGDRAKNIATFGALAQIARAEGGAPSAAEAARSMGGFANTFKKSARDKEFSAIVGKSAYTDKTHTTLRDPMDLIRDALKATKGDQLKMNKIFMDVVGGRTVTGLAKTYNGAGGGAGGIAAVDKQFARMLQAQMSKKEVAESSAAASATTKARAQRFQNQWDQVADQAMSDLLPHLEEAGDGLLKFAKVAGAIATWMVSNPKAAIAGAITASIARAGVESAFRAGIERVILGAGNSRAGKVGAIASAAGGALTIASIAATVITVAQLYAEQMYDQTSKEFSSGIDKATKADDLTKAIQQAMATGDMAAAEKLARKQVELRQGAAQDIVNSETYTGIDKYLDQMARGALITFGQGDTLKASDKAVAEQARQQIIELQNSKTLLAEIRDAIKAQKPGEGDGGGSDERGSQ